MPTQITTPRGPWQNPELDPGTYPAVVKRIMRGTYNQDDTFFQILIWLPEHQYHIATNIYLPKVSFEKSQRRAWRFCQCVGLQLSDLLNTSSAFKGKELRIQIYTVTPKTSGAKSSYSDVKLFLPPLIEEHSEEPGDESSDDLTF